MIEHSQLISDTPRNDAAIARGKVLRSAIALAAEGDEAAFLGSDNVYNTDPGARVDRERIADYVRIFFTELPPKQREVFDLVDLQGHEPAEVARLLGTNAGTVRGNLFKARSALRARLLEDHPSWRELEK